MQTKERNFVSWTSKHFDPHCTLMYHSRAKCNDAFHLSAASVRHVASNISVLSYANLPRGGVGGRGMVTYPGVGGCIGVRGFTLCMYVQGCILNSPIVVRDGKRGSFRFNVR